MRFATEYEVVHMHYECVSMCHVRVYRAKVTTCWVDMLGGDWPWIEEKGRNMAPECPLSEECVRS